MLQFSRKFEDLKNKLDDAHRAAKGVDSTKAANAELKQKVQEFQAKAAAAEGASESVTRLNEEIKQKDSQIMAIQERLHRVDLDSQPQYRSAEAEAEVENDLDDCLSDDVPYSPDQKLTQARDPSCDRNTKKSENVAIDTPVSQLGRRKRRVSANRVASTLQMFEGTADGQIPRKQTSESVGSAPLLGGENPGDVLSDQDPDETNFIPDSQAHATDVRSTLGSRQLQESLPEQATISSPLSDIGEIFDPLASSQAEPSHHFERDTQSKAPEETVQGGVTEGTKRLMKDQEQSDDLVVAQRRLSEVHSDDEEPCQEDRLASSSYGEPLLLDDLEGLGTLPARTATNGGHEKHSKSSTQDVLTSPIETMPRKLPRKIAKAGRAAIPLLRSEMKAVGRLGYDRNLAKDPSPRRLRSHEGPSQTKTEQSPEDLGDNATNTRPATPSIPTKERPQPNSAVKRKSEAAEMVEETVSNEEKRAKRNMSNMEVNSRQKSGSQALRSLIPGRGEQSASRPMQSSMPRASSRNSTSVGKHAPAPGRGKGPKKPRGGSKSEECLIITISRGY